MEKIKEEIKKQLDSPATDLNDIGNSIGIAIGKYISEEIGFEKNDLLAGINHGISLVDGTHNNPKLIKEPDFYEMYQDALKEYEEENGEIIDNEKLDDAIAYAMEYAYYKKLD